MLSALCHQLNNILIYIRAKIIPFLRINQPLESEYSQHLTLNLQLIIITCTFYAFRKKQKEVTV